MLVDRKEIEKLLVLTAALESGLIDALADGGKTAAEVSGAARTDLRATGIVLDALVDVGAVESSEEGGERRYRLSAEGRRRLVDPGPDLERNSLLHQAGKARGWLELPYVLKHGRPRKRERSPDGLKSFVRTMAEGDPEAMDEVVERILGYAGEGSTPEPMTVLDAGGAVGHMARRFRERGLEATLCDRPEVLEEAWEYQGEGARQLNFHPCDFTQDLPRGPFDVIYLGNVYHIYGPVTNAELTRRVFRSLRPGGSIAIRDFVLGRSTRAPMFAVNMLQATQEGGVWREAQYGEWLKGAGFEDIQVVDLDNSDNQLVLGRRPR